MAKKKRAQSGTHALQALEKAGVAYTLHEYEHSEHMDRGYAIDSAQILGFELGEVFKTLMANVDGKPACAVVPANAMLNLKSLAKAAGGKRAQMMDPSAAERLTGYVTGGISPIGQRKACPTFIDASAQGLARMLVSGGKRTLSVELAPADLAALTRGSFAPLADHARHFRAENRSLRGETPKIRRDTRPTPHVN